MRSYHNLTHLGTLADGKESILGICGFISRMGEPANVSSPRTISVHPLTSRSSTMYKPIGFGPLGLLEAKIPTLELPNNL